MIKICDNCRIEKDKGKVLLNRVFLCSNCIEGIEWKINRALSNQFYKLDLSPFYGILWIVIFLGLLLSFIQENAYLLFIPLVAIFIYFFTLFIQKTVNKARYRHLIINATKTLEKFNDYLNNWYTYPPDWENRREKVIKRDKNQCVECGSSRNLHVHHIVSIRKGGNHTLSNLKTLCVKCHSNQKGHGGLYEMHKVREGMQEVRERWSDIKYIRNFTEHKAMKSYTCYICNRTINPEDFYYRGGFYDREIHRGETYHICFSCWKKRHG